MQYKESVQASQQLTQSMEGEIVIKRWEDLDGEVSSYRLCCILSTLPPIDSQGTNDSAKGGGQV